VATFRSILPPKPDHLRAIGLIAVQWTSLEKAIEMLVWELATLKQPKAQAVTTHLSNKTLIDIAKSLSREALKGTEFENRVIDQLDYIENILRPKRNSIIHGVWAPTAFTDKIVLFETTARGILKLKVGSDMTAEDILMIASEIDQRHFDLTTLTFEISMHLGQATKI